MTKRTKIILSSSAIVCVVFSIFVVVSLVHAFKGIDASKEDPKKLFMFYVQKPIPPDISVQSAVGHANFGGTSITFWLKITSKDLDVLIASKGLRKEDSLQEHLFPDKDLAAMKQPEFYATDKDTTWSKLGTTVRVAADREAGTAFYLVFCP
jgi:hypothetical protein